MTPSKDDDTGGRRVYPPFPIHVLPQGFQRIRYYGFLANRYREQKLALCRELLDTPTQEPPTPKAANDYRQRYEELTGSSLSQCPVCHQDEQNYFRM